MRAKAAAAKKVIESKYESLMDIQYIYIGKAAWYHTVNKFMLARKIQSQKYCLENRIAREKIKQYFFLTHTHTQAVCFLSVHTFQ